MKAQAHFFDWQRTANTVNMHYWHKCTSNNKASVKNSQHFPFRYTLFGHLPVFHLKIKWNKIKKNGVNFKHRFAYTYMLVKEFYHLLLYFLRVLNDSIHLFKCQQMENHSSSSSSWHGPSTLLMAYITLKTTALLLPIYLITIAWYCNSISSQVNKKKKP